MIKKIMMIKLILSFKKYWKNCLPNKSKISINNLKKLSKAISQY
jgi:hypothetical protein